MRDDRFYYLQSLHKLAAVDGEVGAGELAYLDALAARLGVAAADIEASDDPEPWLKIEDPVLRKLLVKDLCFVSHADGQQGPSESSFIRRIVESFDLHPDVFKEIDDFVKQGIAWIDRGQSLFGLRLM